MASLTILVLGGYGNFGKRIVENLIDIKHINILVAGRDEAKATALADKLRGITSATLKPIEIDINAFNFEERLQKISPDIVIHTSGPFQGQDYRVALACINTGCHYIDLADDRRFVCDIVSLDQQAKDNNVLIVSGASTVPGLSSSVIDYYSAQFNSISSIDLAIAPGNQAERGEATVNAILSYTGKPFEVFCESDWHQIYGWMDPRKIDFGDIVGTRWLANVDVPDLEIFPLRYSVLHSVKFQAGLELAIMHLPMVAMAWLAKKEWIENWSSFTKQIVKLSNLFLTLGSDQGGMQIIIDGTGTDDKPKTIKWSLYADNGVGPYTPTLAAIILVKKLMANSINKIGATPCLDLFSRDDFYAQAEAQGIYFREELIG